METPAVLSSQCLGDERTTGPDGLRRIGNVIYANNRVQMMSITKGTEYRLMIKNFSSCVSVEGIINFINKQVKGLKVIAMKQNPFGYNCRVFLEFAEIEQREKFLKEVNGYKYEGKALKVCGESLVNVEDTKEVPPRLETFGISTDILKGLNISLPLVKELLITNVQPQATETDIRELFSVAGDVVRVAYDASKHQAIVEMSREMDAVEAISMLHSQEYFDEIIAVRMLRSNNVKTLALRGLKTIGTPLKMPSNTTSYDGSNDGHEPITRPPFPGHEQQSLSDNLLQLPSNTLNQKESKSENAEVIPVNMSENAEIIFAEGVHNKEGHSQHGSESYLPDAISITDGNDGNPSKRPREMENQSNGKGYAYNNSSQASKKLRTPCSSSSDQNEFDQFDKPTPPSLAINETTNMEEPFNVGNSEACDRTTEDGTTEDSLSSTASELPVKTTDQDTQIGKGTSEDPPTIELSSSSTIEEKAPDNRLQPTKRWARPIINTEHAVSRILFGFIKGYRIILRWTTNNFELDLNDDFNWSELTNFRGKLDISLRLAADRDAEMDKRVIFKLNKHVLRYRRRWDIKLRKGTAEPALLDPTVAFDVPSLVNELFGIEFDLLLRHDKDTSDATLPEFITQVHPSSRAPSPINYLAR